MDFIRRKWLLIVLLLILCFLIVVRTLMSTRHFKYLVARYFVDYSYQPPAINYNQTNVSTTKTYRNTEFGFEFKYPKDWTFEENVFSNQFSRFNLTGAPAGEKINPFFSHFLINIVTPGFADSSFSDLRGADITVVGISGKKYEYKEEGINYITIIIPFGEYKMILGATKEYEDVFNQIIASFKFLNQTSSNRIIYRNDEYGFTYQYPSNLIFKEMNFPTYTFTDSGEVCKNLLQEESKSRRLLHITALIDPSTKFKVEVVTVEVYENLDNLSLDDWLNSGTKFLEKHLEECQYDDSAYIEIHLRNKKDVVLDNTSGVQGFAGCCMISDKVTYLAKNTKIYKLTFSGSVNDNMKCMSFSDNKSSCPTINEDVYNQILASFKFLK